MATQGKRLRVLNEIYDSLPTVECKGLCWQSCAAVPAHDIELLNLRVASKCEEIPLLGGDFPNNAKVIAAAHKDLTCPFLILRRCSVYDARPLICRVFAVAEGLPCSHGCKPSRVLPNEEVTRIQLKIAKL